MRLSLTGFPWPLDQFVEFLPADLYRVRGLSVRNRSSGLGAPLIAVERRRKGMPFHRSMPATDFLRVESGVRDLATAPVRATLELHSGYNRGVLEVAGHPVPLQTDLTAPVAHALNQSVIWRLGSRQFFSSAEPVPSGVYPMQPFQRGRVPVVFVHGTFSSPIWWAEMWNTLAADPVLSRRFQCWYFVYNSGNPIGTSARRLRESLTEVRNTLDPEGDDPMLARMVVVGHSQGGLLARLTVTDSGDRLWRVLCDQSIDDFEPDPKAREELRSFTCFEPLPFVKRVVFLSTPHRGSYLATSWINRLAARFMTLSKDALGRVRTAPAPREAAPPARPRGRHADEPLQHVAGERAAPRAGPAAAGAGGAWPFDQRCPGGGRGEGRLGPRPCPACLIPAKVPSPAEPLLTMTMSQKPAVSFASPSVAVRGSFWLRIA